MEQNLIFNPNFKLGLRGWSSNMCTAVVLGDNHDSGGIKMETCCLVTDRKECWQGLEQEISAQLQVNVKYRVTAFVKAFSKMHSMEDVQATLRIESPCSPTKYIFLGKIKASDSEWFKLQGSFYIDFIPEKATFYIEGPPAGIDILIQNVDISPCIPLEQSPQAMHKQNEQAEPFCKQMDSVLKNPDFGEGLKHWYGKGCKISLLESQNLDHNLESKGGYIVAATNRTSGWQGLEQEVTGRLKVMRRYQVSATVRIRGDKPSAEVTATLWIKNQAQQEQYITLGKVTASSSTWTQLKGSLFLNKTPAKATAYIEGPPSGIDLLIDSFFIFLVIKPEPERPIIEDPKFGVNIVKNFDFSSDLSFWKPLGSCSLHLGTGAPLILPPAARQSLGVHLPVTGHYIAAMNRKYIWEGPSQNITDEIIPYVPYQVSAWVRIGPGGSGPQKVNVALGVDNQWVNGGEVEGDPDLWKEVAGSFRFEKKPQNVLLYVQGPPAGIDLMVANLQIFAVDRTARFPMLKAQTEKIRKRDVVIQVKDQNGHPIPNVNFHIDQTKNTFPLGSCINHYSIESDSYVDFFLKNFNWAVFENEVKWYWTEKEQNKLNYKDADELCDFCARHNIPARGHCILWETEGAVQEWVKNLNLKELAEAVQERVIDIVSRYKGKFVHYDVNNEMLHGSFYKDRLGSDILPYMFKLTHQFDPAAKLFVNDYHVEDGYDANSSPDKYIHQIKDLQSKGAPIHGIGLQGHLEAPIGSIVSTALDKLAKVGLPIWFTEVDVASSNQYVRADDLEVILREAYAHPAVDGILLWGFWETAMHRENAHLVDADGTVNEAGKILMTLKQEWKSNFMGDTDDMGCFCFNGYHGAYTIRVATHAGTVQKEFNVDKGEMQLILEVQI